MDADLGDSFASGEERPPGADHHRSQEERDAQAKQVLGPAGFLWALITAASTKNLSLVAAGVAFYMMLSLFPAIAVGLSLLSWFSIPNDMTGYMEAMKPALPADVFNLINSQVQNTASQGGFQLGSAALISFGIAFWSASAVVRALMTAMHMSFEASRGLNLVLYFLLSFLFTLAGVAVVGLMIGLLVVLPLVFEALRQLSDDRIQIGTDILSALELPIMILALTLILMAIYRMGSARGRHASRAAFLGAATATMIWIASTRLLFTYFSTVGDLATTYGSLAAVAGLMLWFWVSAFILLLGAEFANIASGERPSDRTEMG